MQVEQLSINTLYHLDCLGLHCCEKKKLYIKFHDGKHMLHV